MRESAVERIVTTFAKANGVFTLKLASQNHRGQSDRLFQRHGKTIFIELKATGKKAEALQNHFIRGRREDGFFADSTDSPEQAITWIREHLLNDQVEARRK